MENNIDSMQNERNDFRSFLSDLKIKVSLKLDEEGFGSFLVANNEEIFPIFDKIIEFMDVNNLSRESLREMAGYLRDTRRKVDNILGTIKLYEQSRVRSDFFDDILTVDELNGIEELFILIKDLINTKSLQTEFE